MSKEVNFNMYFKRSKCPIANSLEAFGDTWTLVILRDMINGKSKFAEFLTSPELITPSVLTKRLKAMEEGGLIVQKQYSERPKRFEYHLTDMGRALWPILRQLCLWGNEYIPGTWQAPEKFMKG